MRTNGIQSSWNYCRIYPVHGHRVKRTVLNLNGHSTHGGI